MEQVLYISYDGMTDPLGQSQVLPYLVGLSRIGYKITLLSCEKPARYETGKQTITNICTEAGINWQPIPYTASPPVISTIKDVRAISKAANQLHKKYNFKIVHCRSYISALIGQSMQKKYGTKFLFDMRGFWADERVDGGLWHLSNPLFRTIYNYFKKKEIQYLSQANHIISLTYAGQQDILNRKNISISAEKITVIPCCVDTELFNPATIKQEDKNELRQLLNIKPGQPVLGYVGSIGTWYLMNEMLDYFKAFKEKFADAVMFFVTTEPAEQIHTAASQKNIPIQSVIVKPAARKEVPLYIGIMDYSIFFIKPSYSKKASSPTKQGELMAMGIPVCCNAGVGDTDFVVDKYHSGIAVKEFNHTAYIDAVDTLTTYSFSPEEIRAGAIDFYGLQQGIDRYASVYNKILQ